MRTKAAGDKKFSLFHGRVCERVGVRIQVQVQDGVSVRWCMFWKDVFCLIHVSFT